MDCDRFEEFRQSRAVCFVDYEETLLGSALTRMQIGPVVGISNELFRPMLSNIFLELVFILAH